MFQENTFMPLDVNVEWLSLTFLIADSVSFLYVSSWVFTYYYHVFGLPVVYTLWAFEILDFFATGATILAYIKSESWDMTAQIFFAILCGFGCHIAIVWPHVDSPKKMLLSCLLLDFTTDLPMLILTLQTDVYSQNWVMTCALVIQFLTFIRGIIWIPLNLTRAIVEFSEPEDNEYVNLDSFESFEKKYVEYMNQGGAAIPKTASDLYLDELWQLQQQLRVSQVATKGYEIQLNQKENVIERQHSHQTELEQQHSEIAKQLSYVEANLEQSKTRMETLQSDVEETKNILRKSELQKEEIYRFRREVQDSIEETKRKLEDRQDEVHRIRALLDRKEGVWSRNRKSEGLPKRTSTVSRPPPFPAKYSNGGREFVHNEPLRLDPANHAIKLDVNRELAPPAPEDYYQDDIYADFQI